MVEQTPKLQVGQQVTVTQQIPQRDDVWAIKVTGTIEKLHQQKTGSWFAHAKDDKLWLDRMTLRKDDGEIISLVLDAYSHVQVHPPAAAATEAETKTDSDVAEASDTPDASG